MRREFEFEGNRGDLTKFLAEIAADGWLINAQETYMTATSTIYVGYK